MEKTKKLWIVTAILIVVNVLFFLIKPGGETVLMYVSDFFPVVCSFIAILCLISAYNGFTDFDYTKKAWLLLVIGITFYFVAETIYAIQEIALGMDMNENFPGIADYFWCIAYIPIFIGLIMIFTGYKKSGLPMGNPKLYFSISAIILLISLLIIYFLLIPVIQDEESTFIEKAFYLFYPIADILVVIPAAILIYITSLFGAAIITKPWKYLALGFICFTVADLLYSYLSWQDLYGNGNLIDVAWNAGYLFLGLAGLYQRQLVESLNKG